MGWIGATGIAFALAFVASMSATSVYAQPFYVTTSKGVYDSGERVVVAGIVSDTEDRRPVLVTIMHGEDECATQNVRPLRDGSFISRPMIITSCGSGDFNVTATHAGESASMSFVVEGMQQVADSFELRAIKVTVIKAQDVVNARMQEMLDANLAIPERAAEAHGRGVAEASNALQAVDRGDVNAASKHRTAALANFREALDLLSPERMNAVTEDIREEQTRAIDTGEWFGRLQDLFRRLVDLADKNGLGTIQESGQIDGLLTEAGQLISERKNDSAEQSLQSADRLLEDARKKLIQQAEGEDSQVRALTSAAERLESSAHTLHDDAASVPRALAKVNASFVLIDGARSSIADGEYDSAKSSLDSALKFLEEAKWIIESSH